MIDALILGIIVGQALAKAARDVMVFEEAEMEWDLSQIALWLVTVLVGAGIVKVLDLVGRSYERRKSRRQEEATRLRNHLALYAKITAYYRSYANLRTVFPKDEHGQPLRDSHGDIVPPTTTALEEVEAWERVREKDVDTLIAEQWAEISVDSAEMSDIALGLDPSGGLKEQLFALNKKMLSIELILANKDHYEPIDAYRAMREALEGVDGCRRSVRSELDRF